MADPTRLEQVFVNLLTNAAKYTHPGGRVEVATRTEENDVVATVGDNGIGIPSEAMTTIFDMFTRAIQSADHNPDGLGIGLTLVDRIVRLHGGTVKVRSNGPGRGSEFEVRLPASHFDFKGPDKPGSAVAGWESTLLDRHATHKPEAQAKATQ